MIGRALRHISRRRRNQRRTREQLLARNLQRFRDLVRFLRRASPYYGAVIDEHGIAPGTARPEDFPVLTKADLIEHFDAIATRPGVTRARIDQFLASSRDPRDLMDRKYHVVHTSGTSGQVCYVAYDRNEWLAGATQFERIVRFGWRKKIAFVGATQGHFAGATLALAGRTALSRFAYLTRPFDLNLPTTDLVAGLNEFMPRVLSGYAKALVRLGEEQAAGRLRIAPRVIVCGGESVSQPELARLWEVFGAQSRNAYATSEHLFMGFSLPHDPGMYLAEDDLIFELREDHILVTNLFNRTVPLIRHRINDVLEPASADAARNGPYLTVRTVLGRREEAPEFRNEDGAIDYIHPIVIAEFFVKHLAEFQFHCLDETSFRFDAVVAGGLDAGAIEECHRECRAQLDGILGQKRMRNVSYDVRIVDRLERDPKSRKFKLIVR